MLLPGTYANGFAPRDGRPLYPELWKGCVGAWNPGLGVSGLTLRDWSGFGNHGTLTNMTSGSAWSVVGGKFALTFDGVNDYVESAQKLSSVPEVTAEAWIRTSTVSREILAIYNLAGVSILELYLPLSGNPQFYIYKANGSAQLCYREASVAVNDGKWHHVAGVFSGLSSRLDVYIDGLKANGTLTGTIPSTTNTSTEPMRIGAYNSGGFFSGSIGSVRTYVVAVSDSVIRLLSSRDGIAYEMAPRRRSSVQVTTNRRRRIIIGGNR